MTQLYAGSPCVKMCAWIVAGIFWYIGFLVLPAVHSAIFRLPWGLGWDALALSELSSHSFVSSMISLAQFMDSALLFVSVQ